jgi:hypothetical protein
VFVVVVRVYDRVSLSRSNWRPNLSRGASAAKPGALSLVPSAEPAALRQESWSDPGQFDVWRIGVRRTVLTHVAEFVANRCAAELDEAGVEVAGDILLNFLTGGKCLRDGQFRTALVSRDIIGQAKGMLRERFNIDAAEAFRLLTRLSQDSNTRVAQLAEQVVAGDHAPR